jgi:hypothetical protein
MFSNITKNEDPWYLHTGLYVVVAILAFILIKVAIIDPQDFVEKEKYFKTETRLRMSNLREAEILWQRKTGSFTNNLDKLINFIKTDKFVDSVVNAFDSLTMKPANPFETLLHGEFSPDSLFRTPKSHQQFIVQIDTSVQSDTVVAARTGKVLRVETKTVIGKRYLIEDPDGYGTVGSLDNDALKNAASWE